mgnify:CR=1 FL=1
MKLWGGRFQKDTDLLVNELNASISFDQRLYREDITGSMAHAAMLADCGIISKEDAAAITSGLEDILADIEAGKAAFTADNEDIHMNVEALLTARIGDAGKRLHTARSRNDQVALDFRMYVREQIPVIVGQLLELETVLCRQAKKHQTAVMPGYTHLQRAQPTTFGHYMMAYANMFKRDVTRLEDCLERLDECPLGAGALATTTYPVDRFQTAKALGFRKPTDNSMDSVSDRDYAIELLSALSILMMHLSRFSEEIILWCSWEFKFVDLDDAYSTGSSIMPQKKNPDVPELARGKTGRVVGHLMGLITLMKGQPLAYNKDNQEDKEPLFDTVDTLKDTLRIFAEMIGGQFNPVTGQKEGGITVNAANMRAAALKGYATATALADYLVKKGLPFRDAHETVAHAVKLATQKGVDLSELPLEELQSFNPNVEADVFEVLSLEGSLNARNTLGGTAPAQVRIQLAKHRTRLA